MTATFRFAKYLNGKGAFAELTIEAVPSQNFSIEWSEGLDALRRLYGGAVRLGLEKAYEWHRQSNPAPVAFTVRSLIDLVVDTKPDAVECAATAAAWKALGHSENDLVFSFNDRWSVSLRSPS